MDIITIKRVVEILNAYRPEYLTAMIGDWRPVDALRLRLRQLARPEDTAHLTLSDTTRCLGFSPDNTEFNISLLNTDFLVQYALVRELKPQLIVETGVQNGYITELFLGALEKNQKGKLISFDCGAEPGDISTNKTWNGIPGQYVRDEFRHRWELVLGKTYDTLPPFIKDLKQHGTKIDIFHHDSDHSTECINFEFNAVKDLIAENGIIFLHDHDNRIFDIEQSGEFIKINSRQNAFYIRNKNYNSE